MQQDSLFTPDTQQPVILLVDNGSRRPQAVFGLRSLAANLSEIVGLKVEPVSLLHSHKIPTDDIGGEAALIVRQRLKLCAQNNENTVIVIPAFIGPSAAISEYLPKVIAEEKEENPALNVTICKTLCGDDPTAPDPRLAQILFDHVLAHTHSNSPATVAVVDHGTPIKVVNTVRNAIATQVATLCQAHQSTVNHHVIASSMERREGDEYAFNEPLLENLTPSKTHQKHCIAAMLFLLPGRHAGEGGDVADICDALIADGLFEDIQISKLMSEHPLLPLILKDRLAEKYSVAPNRETRITQYLHLTRNILPQLAQQPSNKWPVQEDHCFQRIILDNICNGVWYASIKQPAYLHMTDAQAEHAMQLCWDICAEKVNLTELNQRSLVWRS
jgi:sirohydrochlorin ferrochelatase